MRAIGGVVLVGAMLWCGLIWLGRRVPGPRIAVLVVLYLVLFALSHAIAEPIGIWSSVALVAVVMAAATYAAADRTHPHSRALVTR